MRNHSFATFAQRTATAAGRRATVKTVGKLVLLAAFTQPVVTKAGKFDKKARNKARKKIPQLAQQMCAQQGSQCLAFFEDRCAESEDPQRCLTFLTPCCPGLGQCNPGAFLSCLIEAVRNSSNSTSSSAQGWRHE
jgi:hypothetical protein